MKDFKRIMDLIDRNHALLMAEYSENQITIPAAEKWDYAIPENYTNYQDGFLFPNSDSYRGYPLMRYNGEVLYIRWEVPFYRKSETDDEKHLCFDRHGRKYTVTFTRSEMPEGNPSYFRFLPLVKKYQNRRK